MSIFFFACKERETLSYPSEDDRDLENNQRKNNELPSELPNSLAMLRSSPAQDLVKVMMVNHRII